MLHELARQVKGEIARDVAQELAMARDLADELAEREAELGRMPGEVQDRVGPGARRTSPVRPRRASQVSRQERPRNVGHGGKGEGGAAAGET